MVSVSSVPHSHYFRVEWSVYSVWHQSSLHPAASEACTFTKYSCWPRNRCIREYVAIAVRGWIGWVL